MERIIYNDKLFILYEYPEENEFEKHVIQHANEIFGPKAVYIDIKKRIGEDNILTIPDGYLVDCSFESDPRLYIIENELVTHDPYKHIGQQLLKFAISYKMSGRNIKNFLLENILKDKPKKAIIEEAFKKAGYRNIDAFIFPFALVVASFVLAANLHHASTIHPPPPTGCPCPSL